MPTTELELHLRSQLGIGTGCNIYCPPDNPEAEEFFALRAGVFAQNSFGLLGGTTTGEGGIGGFYSFRLMRRRKFTR